MQLRVGGWLLALAFGALALLKASQLVIVGHHATTHAGKRPPADAVLWDLTSNGTLALSILIVLGLSSCALGSSRWPRRLFATAALTSGLPLVTRILEALEVALEDEVVRGLHAIAVCGVGCLAGAAIARGAGKRLLWCAFPIVAWCAMLTAVRPGGAWSITMPLDLVGCLLALDVLDAFPDHVSKLPRAPTPPGTRRLATTLCVAFVGAGCVLAWVATDEMLVRSTPRMIELFYGYSCVLTGCLGLWRMHRSMSPAIVIALVFVGIGIARTVVELAVRPIDEVKLSSRELPGFRVALPSGIDATRAWRDQGTVEVQLNHGDLERASLSWGHLVDPRAREGLSRETVDVNGVEVSFELRAVRDRNFALVFWRCAELGIRLTLTPQLWVTRGSLEALASRIARTAGCEEPMPWIPNLSIPVSLPATYRKELDGRIWSYLGPNDTMLRVNWTNDADWGWLLWDRPALMFDWLDGPSELRRDRVTRGITPIDGDLRNYGEIIHDQRRKLVAVMDCGQAKLWVAIGLDAPSTTSRDQALDLLRAVRCP